MTVVLPENKGNVQNSWGKLQHKTPFNMFVYSRCESLVRAVDVCLWTLVPFHLYPNAANAAVQGKWLVDSRQPSQESVFTFF